MIGYEDKSATAVCTLAFCPYPHADPVVFVSLSSHVPLLALPIHTSNHLHVEDREMLGHNRRTHRREGLWMGLHLRSGRTNGALLVHGDGREMQTESSEQSSGEMGGLARNKHRRAVRASVRTAGDWAQRARLQTHEFGAVGGGWRAS